MKNFLLFFSTFAVLALSATEPATVADAFSQGRLSLNARLRFEHVDQIGALDANAFTLRTRLGFTTARFHGWQAMLEGENVFAFDKNAYNQSGLNPAAGSRAVVGDPETTEINQLWLAYTLGQISGTLGRQRLVLDNARFVGDVGWRQNQQTFDAVVLQSKSLADTTLTYAYLDQINRVFSRRHVQGRWESDSHLIHAHYTGFDVGVIRAYAYLLDFDNAATSSSATYGASLNGTPPLNDTVKLSYRVELAWQNDHGNNPQDYSTHYALIEAGPRWKSFGIALGHERLGSDNAVGFKTPLATLHAHNGWADLFLNTPTDGLRDTYVKAEASLPEGVALVAFYHWFEANRGAAHYGEEFDLQLSRKLGKAFTATAKFAGFRRDSPAFVNARKIWFQLEYVY